MFASLLDTAFKLIKLDIKARLRALTVSAVLTVLATVLLLIAVGFGVALFYIWLQQVLGTYAALAIIGGGCLVLALILFALALWRPKPGDKPAKRVATPPPPPPPPPRTESAAAGATDRLIGEAVAAMQQGSREQMVVALSLALVTGIIMGRRS